MNINKAFPSKYLKAADLGGHRTNVIIDSVGFEDIGDDTDKMVVYFRGKKKGLVCNVTNARTIAEIAKDDETDNWAGCMIQLYATKVDFQGRRVEAIRVCEPNDVGGRVPAAPPPPVDSNDDNILF